MGKKTRERCTRPNKIVVAKSSSISLGSNLNCISIRPLSGYKTCLAKKGICEGVLYYEVYKTNANGHARIGFGTKKCELKGPLGYDRHGYSYGSKHGYSFHRSVRRSYGTPYGENDVLGALIVLKKECSYIEFYINGKSQGIAFDVPMGPVFYPAISLYNGCKVCISFDGLLAYEAMISLER